MREYINFIQKVFEPEVTTEAKETLNAYYSYLRHNPRVSKDRKSVRMLESLIRLTEAHARMLMRPRGTLFDAISVIVLMEHCLETCLFGADPTPSVLFESERDYQETKFYVMQTLG